MGQSESRVLHRQTVEVAIQLRYGDGAVSDTVTVDFFEIAELHHRTWAAITELARAHALLPSGDSGVARIRMRSINADSPMLLARVKNLNLAERLDLWWVMFREPCVASRLVVVADLLAAPDAQSVA